MSSLVLAVVSLALGGPHAAQAQYTCSAVATPGTDLQAFADDLQPGTIGCLRGGTHSFDGLVVRTPDITLTSYPGERATLKGRMWVDSHDVTVVDLNIDGRNQTGLPSPSVTGRGNTFRGLDVTNHHTGICFTLGHPDWGRAVDTVIEDSRIHDCGHLPATNYDHGIYISAADGTIIRDNQIYDNADRGIQLYPDARNTTIAGNVIDGNGQGVSFGGNGKKASRRTLVTRNIITNSNLRYNVESSFDATGPIGGANVVRNNCIFGAESWYGEGDGDGIQEPQVGFDATNNLAADPMYENAAADDFDLAAGSPCQALGERVVLKQATHGAGAVQVDGVVPGPIASGQKVSLQVRRNGHWRALANRRLNQPEFSLRVPRTQRAYGANRLRARSIGRMASRPMGLSAR